MVSLLEPNSLTNPWQSPHTAPAKSFNVSHGSRVDLYDEVLKYWRRKLALYLPSLIVWLINSLPAAIAARRSRSLTGNRSSTHSGISRPLSGARVAVRPASPIGVPGPSTMPSAPSVATPVRSPSNHDQNRRGDVPSSARPASRLNVPLRNLVSA